MRIGLIGDYQESVAAHRAIPKALELAATELAVSVEFDWLHSNELSGISLNDYVALWCVPASPYQDNESVLHAIRYAREEDVPFLGTCGGYQYAALEFAQTVLGYSQAENTEVQPETTMPLISSLACKLYDESARIKLIEKSKIARIYGENTILEEYYCGYGVNSEYLQIFDGTDLYFSGFDEDGDPRSLEITTKKFFIGTAFQPERSAFNGISHPLICAYLSAAISA